ncbi:MAG TPA: spore coat protein [Symbiobacteriaceae bacterium]|nr:spore coat protein [Symbiobacteriaceae bacterium]
MAPNAGGSWGDADIMTDVLTTAKGQTKFYATAATESANPGVGEVFKAFHGEEQHNLETVFSFLHTRGEYPTPLADKQQLRQTIERFEKAHSTLGISESPTTRRYKTADPEHPPKADAGAGAFDYKADTLQ